MKSRRGQILVSVAVGWVFFMGLVAGMFDVIFIFAARAKLIAAVDAAAIAATRELVSGTTPAEQQATVNRIVRMMFNANFPDGHFLSTASGFDAPILDTSAPGLRRVTITGFATVPTFFLGVFGHTTQELGATAVATRRDSNVMLTLDRSGSMNYFGGAPWAALQTAVPLFVGEFSEQNDRMGAVFYATNPFVDYTIQYPTGSQPFKTDITTIVNAHSPGGWTNIAGALYESYDELRDLADPDALNVIVLFSDGRLTALTNQFPVNTVVGGGSGTWCEASATEPASPRWGTVVACHDIAGSPCSTTTPRGPYIIDLMLNNPIINCFQADGDPYTGGGTEAENLVLEVPTSWQPRGSGDSFSISHLFNPGLPGSPIQLSEADIITLAGENLALNVAEQARQDGFIIYTIGLGADVNPVFMEAIANDPDSTFHNPAQPTGEYIFSADADGLIEAFLRVAANVTHLTQ